MRVSRRQIHTLALALATPATAWPYAIRHAPCAVRRHARHPSLPIRVQNRLSRAQECVSARARHRLASGCSAPCTRRGALEDARHPRTRARASGRSSAAAQSAA
eukprot:6186716-Pleurochrysis_carterae.AAC.3